MGIWNFSDLFSRKREDSSWPEFSIPVGMLLNFWGIKFSARKLFEGGRKKKKNTVSKIFNVYENDYNLTGNTEFLARSIFNSSANFGPLVTNGGALESWHQGRVCFWPSGRGQEQLQNILCKNVEGKQTAWQWPLPRCIPTCQILHSLSAQIAYNFRPGAYNAVLCSLWKSW